MARDDAPLPVQVDLAAAGTAVRTGRLELRVADGRETLLHWTSDEWTVAGGGARSAAVLLPPLDLDHGHDAVVAHATWHERGGAVSLGEHTVAAADRGGRELVLAFCPPTVSAQAAGHLNRAVALDGGGPARDGDETRLRQTSLRLSNEHLPRHALGWCAYDAALIAGDSLAGLSDEQLAALERWVLAGGSCCLAVDGALPPRLGALLGRCVGEAAAAEAAAGFAEHRRWHAGLGRLVLAPMADQDAGRWAASTAWLWRLRGDAAALFTSDRARFQALTAQRAVRQGWQEGGPQLVAPLVDLLLPRQITIIPLPIILGVFLLFVLAIGPGDWFLLGALRARRFTWLLFPALAIGCTLFMVWLSERYLGGRDQRQMLSIVDVAADGSVLRHDRLTLLFTGATRNVEDAPQQALWARLGEGARDPRFGGDDERSGGPALFTGALPGSYQVTRTVNQWTPTLHRELSFAPVALPIAVPWDRVAALLPPESDSMDRDLAESLRAELGAEAVACFQGGGRPTVIGTLPEGRAVSMQRSLDQYGARPDWLSALCWNEANAGWNALTTHDAPRGGATTVDCAVAGDGARLAVVIVRRGDVLWVIRHRLPARPAPAGGPR